MLYTLYSYLNASGSLTSFNFQVPFFIPIMLAIITFTFVILPLFNPLTRTSVFVGMYASFSMSSLGHFYISFPWEGGHPHISSPWDTLTYHVMGHPHTSSTWNTLTYHLPGTPSHIFSLGHPHISCHGTLSHIISFLWDTLTYNLPGTPSHIFSLEHPLVSSPWHTLSYHLMGHHYISCHGTPLHIMSWDTLTYHIPGETL